MTDTRPQPPVQANRSARNSEHRKKSTVALIAIPLVLVLVAGGLVFLLTRGDGKIPFIGGDDTPPVTPIEFKIRKTRAVATNEAADVDALAQQAATIGQELTPMLNDLFTNAFLDPDKWKDGDYAEVWDRFADDARASAEQSVETLTIGATAGDVYDEIEPTKGSLEFDVLFDQEDTPTSVVVKFRFYAFGTRSDGTYTAIISHGQLFLNDSGSWEISAFDVKRGDRAAESPGPPTPGPSASASPSA
ncbi:MAG: hypothetical protein ACXWYJ_12465 [Actinomycetota bacterium]